MGRLFGKKADTMQDELARLKGNPQDSAQPTEIFRSESSTIRNSAMYDSSERQYSSSEKARYLMILLGAVTLVVGLIIYFSLHADAGGAFIQFGAALLYVILFVALLVVRFKEEKNLKERARKSGDLIEKDGQEFFSENYIHEINAYDSRYPTAEEVAATKELNARMDKALDYMDKMTRR